MRSRYCISYASVYLLTGRNRSLVRALVSRRFFASSSSSPEELAKRNYANDLSEYNSVVNSVTAQRRYVCTCVDSDNGYLINPCCVYVHVQALSVEGCV